MASEQGKAPSSEPTRLPHTIYAIAREYVWRRIQGEGIGLATLRTVVRASPLNWPGLAFLLASIAAAAYLSVGGGRLPLLSATLWEGEQVAAPAPALYIFLAVFALGWTYLLVAAAELGLGWYVATATYAAYYVLYVGLALGGSLWFGLIPAWLFVVGVWVASSSPGRTRLPLLAVLSLVVAMLTYPSLGLKALLPGLLGRLVLGAVLFALAANPWALAARRFRPALAWALTLAVLAGFFALCSFQAPPADLFANAFLAAHDMLGPVALFWCWLGLDLLTAAGETSEWLSEVARRLLPPRLLAAAIWVLWGLWCAAGYLLVHGLPYLLIELLVGSGLGRALLVGYRSLQLTPLWLTVLDYDLYITAAVALVALALALTRRLSPERLLGLFGLSLLGFLAVWGYCGVFFAYADAAAGAVGFWPLFLFAAGLVWEVLKSVGGFLSGGRMRTSLFVGLLVLFGAISLLELTAGYPYFEREIGLNAFIGAVYLGIPYLLYTLVYKRLRLAPVAPRRLLLLFTLGMACAIPALVARSIVFAPLLWLAALLAASWRQGDEGHRSEGLVCGLALGLGFVTFYTHPVFIPIPAFFGFLGYLVQVQADYALRVIWPWDGRWWWLMLAGAAAAAGVGLAWAWARRLQPRLRWPVLVVGLALGIALMAACQVALCAAGA